MATARSKSIPASTRPVAAPTAKPARATRPAAPASKSEKPAKPVKADKATKAEKVEKAPKKPKMLRDSFTIPKAEYAAIETLKQRAAMGGRAAKKSELLRAGIMALAAMDDASFLGALTQVPTIKTGRPAKA